MQERALYAALSACVLHAEGGLAGALTRASRRFATASSSVAALSERTPRTRSDCARFGSSPRPLRRGRGADRADRLDRPGRRPPSLRAQSARFRARLAAARGEHEGVEQGFKTAAGIFREHGLTFWMAVAELEHGEGSSPGTRRRGGAAAGGARGIFERLRRRRGSSARTLPRAPRRWPGDLRELRRRERRGPEVLHRMRHGARRPCASCGAALDGTRSSAAIAARSLRASAAAPPADPPAAERGSSPCCSPTSSGSRRSPSSATPRTRASSSPATSTRPGG